MPISSGFTAERRHASHRTQLNRSVRRPQIIARARQFQEDIRNKQRHVPFSNGAAGHRSRPTAVVKQPMRSNTFTLPKKVETQINGKTPKELPKLKGRAPSPAPPPVPPAALRVPKKHIVAYHSAAPIRPTLKPISSMADQRRPVRFASEVNYAYPSASSAWTNLPPPSHHPPPPSYPPVANRTVRTIHDDYPHSHNRNAYTDYPSTTVSDYHPWRSLPPITTQHFSSSSTTSAQPTVIIRSKETYPSNPSYPHSSAPFLYIPSPPMFIPSPSYPYPYAYASAPPPPPPPVPTTSIVNQASSSATSKVDSQPPTIIVPPVQEKQNVTIRLQMADEVQQPVVHVVRRPAPRNYVYVDDADPAETTATTQIIRRRRRRQPEVIYVDEDDDYVDEDVIYVDENGRQIEYIYDEPVRYRSYPKVRQTNSTNVVYQ